MAVSLETLRELGTYAARINSIATSGYGHIFDWCAVHPLRRATWRDYLREDYKPRERLQFLEDHALLSPATAKTLHAELEGVEAWTGLPSLNHGDLRLKNILLNTEGRISSILDWEKCLSQMAPYWELSIALHDLSTDQKEAFLQGYGVSPEHFEQMAPVIRIFNVLNYYAAASHAVEQGDEGALAHLRLRLSGALDLY